MESLLEVTYPGVAHITAADPLLDAWFSERTILCARNDDVDDLNSKILDKFPGQLKTFRSADKAIIEDKRQAKVQSVISTDKGEG